MKKILVVFLSLIIGIIAGYLGLVLRPHLNFGIYTCYYFLYCFVIVVSLVSSAVFTILLLSREINIPRSLFILAIVDFFILFIPFRVTGCF